MKNTKNITICAMLASISTVICTMSGFFPSISLTMLAICGIFSALALSLCGYKYAWIMYVAVSVLSLFLSTDKTNAIYYILLFGHYPIIRTYFERISNKLLSFILKLVLANILFVVAVFITIYITGVLEMVKDSSNILFWVLYNAAFILYDILTGKLMLLYISKNAGRGRFH